MTPFPLVERGKIIAVFESALEVPRRVSYRKNADGTLAAHIEGMRDGKSALKEWTGTAGRLKSPSPPRRVEVGLGSNHQKRDYGVEEGR